MMCGRKYICALFAVASGLRLPAPEGLTRRGVLSSTCALLVSPLTPFAAVADVRGANENIPRDEKGINKLLTGLGYPAIEKVDGCSPLVEYIGTAQPANIDGMKSKGRAFSDTLLVRFVFPNGWLVETPSITENGESGSIGANNYQKGDSAKFAASKMPGGKGLDDLDKEFYKSFLSSQMTNDVYQDIKVSKVKKIPQPDGTDMVMVDFGYELLTRAGFTVFRKGIAGAMVANGALVGVVSATTTDRYKGFEEKFRAIAKSFRAYAAKPPAFGQDSII